jgi:hypothetical protein
MVINNKGEPYSSPLQGYEDTDNPVLCGYYSLGGCYDRRYGF